MDDKIDIAALVAELRADAELHEDLLPDRAANALIAQDAELKRLRAALTEAKETLVEVKRDMWREAAPRWIMADFLNWAIVQRITASIVSTRAALGDKP